MSQPRDLGRYWWPALILILLASVGVLSSQASTGATPPATPDNDVAQTPSEIAEVLPTAEPSPTATPSITEATSPTPTAAVTRVTPPTPTALSAADLPTAAPTLIPTPAVALPTPVPLPPQPDRLDVPILMYHYVSEPPEDADIYRRDLSVTPELFEAHLAYLKAQGYETITLAQLADAGSDASALPAKPIIITFDDGHRDNYEQAFPILQKFGFVGTFFVFTQPVDEYNVDFVTWEMVKEMHAAGMEIGSHSYSHANLKGQERDLLIYEILGSKQAIEERIEEPVRFFAYPAGRYDDHTIEVLQSAGFDGAVTTVWGIQQQFETPFEMRRIRVRGNDQAVHLAMKLLSPDVEPALSAPDTK